MFTIQDIPVLYKDKNWNEIGQVRQGYIYKMHSIIGKYEYHLL